MDFCSSSPIEHHAQSLLLIPNDAIAIVSIYNRNLFLQTFYICYQLFSGLHHYNFSFWLQLVFQIKLQFGPYHCHLFKWLTSWWRQRLLFLPTPWVSVPPIALLSLPMQWLLMGSILQNYILLHLATSFYFLIKIQILFNIVIINISRQIWAHL